MLAALEDEGFGVGALLLGRPDARTMAALAESERMESVLDVVEDDLADTAEKTPEARVSSWRGRRLFDAGWLRSDEMRLELSGVFQRADRRAFGGAACGEIRFLYRLAWTMEHGGESADGRLPMTGNLVFDVLPRDVSDDTDDTDDTDDVHDERAEAGVPEDVEAACRAQVDAWRPPADLDPAEEARWWVSEGALRPELRAQWRFKAFETNVQSIRWQSTVHTTLAGHVEYQMRVFSPADGADADTGALAPTPLENTPDLVRLHRDDDLRQELAAWLREPATVDAIDEGTVVVPTRFLAKRSTSVSPRGGLRLANRYYTQLFDEDEFADVDYGGRATVGSPAALLRRLDQTTCAGCHQSGSIAGFHHLGAEPDDDRVFDGLFTGRSGHLEGELARRLTYAEALVAGESPDEVRPLPETQGFAAGAVGAPCGLGDAGFVAWSCAEGLECVELEDPQVGECRAPTAEVGDACEMGRMDSVREPVDDRVRDLTYRECPGGESECLTNLIAFPQGLCVASCRPGERMSDGSVCADFLDIDGFQKCMRKGDSYGECADAFVYGLAMRECDTARPCRPDYVCARVPSEDGVGPASDVGGCIPAYFAFQLRSDGVPLTQ